MPAYAGRCRLAAASSQQRLRSRQALALAGELATGEPAAAGGAGGGAAAAARLEAAHMEAAFRDVAAARAHLDAALAALGLTVEVTGEDRVRVGIVLGQPLVLLHHSPHRIIVAVSAWRCVSGQRAACLACLDVADAERAAWLQGHAACAGGLHALCNSHSSVPCAVV
jgi:hypothetical protein